MIFEYILFVIIAIFPYILVGQDIGAVLLFLLCSIYLIQKRKNLILPRTKLVYAYLLFYLSFIPSFMISKNIEKSFEGVFIYLDLFMFYLFIINSKLDHQKLLKILYHLFTLLSFVSIVYQGLYQGIRITGNLTYANSFALILLIGFILSDVLQKSKKMFWQRFIFILGIVFTGSRSTFIFLALYILINFIRYKDKKNLIISFSIVLLSFGFYTLKYIHPIIPLGLILIVIMTESILKKRLPIKKPLPTIPKLTFFTIGIIGSIIVFILTPSNLKNRLLNISPENGVVHERLIIFSDVLKNSIKNPLGLGLNSFEYMQFVVQTAYYDVRYVHNSFLQIINDTGIVSLVLFTTIIVFLLMTLIKSNSSNRVEYLCAFLFILLHSFWDFDLSFATICFLLILFPALSSESVYLQDLKMIKLYNFSFVLLIIGGLYTFLTMNLINIGNSLLEANNFIGARQIYSICAQISPKNSDTYFLKAQSFYIEAQSYKSTRNAKKLLLNCQAALNKAEEINPFDPKIIINQAFVNKDLNNINNVIHSYEKSIQMQKYNMQLYDSYYSYLLEMFVNTQNEKYLLKIKDLIVIFKLNHQNQNQNATYLKNQLEIKDWNQPR